MLSLAHIFGPMADQQRYEWSASIAVDLVSRALLPHRFAEIVPGVTIVIGGRQGIGQITGFFADDRRDPERRQTFTANEALIMRTDDGYVLQLTDGDIRYLDERGGFSEVSFNRYDLSLTLFSENLESGGRTSMALINEAMATGDWGQTPRDPHRADCRGPPGHRHLRVDRGACRISRPAAAAASRCRSNSWRLRSPSSSEG